MVTNDFYVAKGKTISARGQRFQEGRRFPAADLGLDQRSFDSLIKDGALVTGKMRNLFVHPAAAPPLKVLKVKRHPVVTPSDDFERMATEDLEDLARDMGLRLGEHAGRKEIIERIKEARRG